MATLGSLIVNVLANTSNFAKGMARARAELASFSGVSSRVKEATSGLNGVLAAVGVGFSMHQVISGLNETANSIDHLADVSDRIGITTENLIGLQHAASYSGIEAEQLASSLQMMNKQLGEAIHGGGKAKDVLIELGLDAQKMANLTPDMALLNIAEAMGKVETQSERVRMGMRLFGSDGAAMVTFLAQGELAIRGYMNEAEKLGLTYSREEAEKVAQFNDAWAKLAKTLGSIGTELVIQIAPEAQELLKALQEGMDGTKLKATNPEKANAWDVTKAVFSTQGRMDLDRKVGKGMSAGAFTDRELGGTKAAERFRAYANGRPSGQMEEKFATERFTKMLEKGFLNKALYDPIRKGPAAIEKGFQQLKSWKKDASEFGAQWSRDQLVKSLMPKPKSQFFIDQEKKLAERDKKRIDEMRSKQYGERFMVRGVNGALQGGTAEAFRAIAESRIQQSMLDHAKKQLEESRKQTDHLSTLASSLSIETTGLN
jgi:hypothetical protein